MKSVAMILAGCGNRDGSEIHESVLSILALRRLGVQIKFYAPNIDQAVALNYLTGNELREKRNCLLEAARIARGQIESISCIRLADVHGIAIPGGYGVALNLSDWVKKGAEAHVRSEIETIIKEAHAKKKAIGAICIAPVIVAMALRGVASLQLTIGNDPETAAKLEKMGHHHVPTSVNGACVDSQNRIVTTPAYMLAKDITDVEKGINIFAEKFVELL